MAIELSTAGLEREPADRPRLDALDEPQWRTEQRPVAVRMPARRGRPLALLQISVIVLTVAAIVAVSAAKANRPAPSQDSTAGLGAPAASVAANSGHEAHGPSARSTASLPPFEQRQLTANRSKLTGDLGAFAEPWLAWVSSCRSSVDDGGPVLRDGEQTRVVCWYGSVAVYFVRYQSVADRDRVRDTVVADNVTTELLAPGAADPAETTSTSGRTSGAYIEYAYQLTTGEHIGETVSGLWWDDNALPVAGYLLAFWHEELGDSWEPLRDVWQRNS